MPTPKPLINLDKFIKFAELQLTTHDHFPHVLVFRRLADSLGLDLEQRIWITLLYMAYYDDASAWVCFSDTSIRYRKELPRCDLPISYIRRNLFGGRIKGHFESIYEIKSLSNWLTVNTWVDLLNRLSEVHGNGRWASYTTAEMLVAVADLPIRPTTYEITGSSGPKQGLEFLGLPPTEDAARFMGYLLATKGMPVPDQILESMLCNWSRMVKGRFYAGHNIDRQQGRVLKLLAKFPDADCSELWRVRKSCFATKTLGELHGWAGIDRPRRKLYKATGDVLLPWEAR